jgi:hypothetical protein
MNEKILSQFQLLIEAAEAVLPWLESHQAAASAYWELEIQIAAAKRTLALAEME